MRTSSARQKMSGDGSLGLWQNLGLFPAFNLPFIYVYTYTDYNMCTVASRRENKNVPSRAIEKKSRTVTSRRGRNYIPSNLVVKYCMHRPVPSSKKIYTVPSRHYNFCLPSRPVVTMFTYLPVPSWQFIFTVPSRHETKVHCTVPSRPVTEIHTHRPVPSPPGNYNFHVFTVPARPVFIFFPAKRIKTVHRPVYYRPLKA